MNFGGLWRFSGISAAAETWISHNLSNSGQTVEPLFSWWVNVEATETVANQEEVMARSKSSGGSKRGFAAMDPAKQREIASKGGKASHGGGRRSSSSR
jgi:general stress protein YciG